METPIRVGVIGAGVMGERHARLYAELPGCTLAGLYDPDIARATEVTGRYGGTVYRQMDDLFTEVDAISIVSPTVTHAAIAHRALDFGLNLLVEKPMTATVTEARLLAQRASDSGLVVLTGHIERFNPVVGELRHLIAGHRVRRVTIRRIAPFDNRCLDTNVVSDLMIHDIDLVQSLFGSEVVRMAARGSAIRTEHTDHAVVDLTLAGGTQVSLVASRVGDARIRQIDVVLETACVLADLLERSISVTSALASDGRSITEQRTVAPAEPLRAELKHFLDCIRGTATPLVDASAGLRAVEWVDQIDALIDQRHVAMLADAQV